MPLSKEPHETKKEKEIESALGPRAQPGIFVLGQGGQIVYQNRVAQRLSQTLKPQGPLPPSQVVSGIYTEFKQWIDTDGSSQGSAYPLVNRTYNYEAGRYSFRALPLQPAGPSPKTAYLLILMEPAP